LATPTTAQHRPPIPSPQHRGLITIGAAILAALIGAVLGGLAGMRFHRNVDKAGLDPIDR